MKNFGSIRNVADASQGIRLSGKRGAAAISGLLIGSLFAVGCNNKDSRPAASQAQNPTTQIAMSQPATPDRVSEPASTTAAPMPKKAARKHPPTAKYSDQTSGVSFRYPWQYAVKSGDAVDSESETMGFIQPGGETTVSVDVPKGFYPDSDFAAAFFRVSVNKTLTEEQCSQFASAVSTGNDAVQPAKVALGGLELQEMESLSGDDEQQGDIKYYHVFQNGACYEFALGLSTQSGGDDETVSPVDRGKVFRRLETILASVKLNPEITPQAASDPTQVSAAKEGSN